MIRAGVTPLHFAADRGHKEVVQLLISKGADVNACTKSMTTPIHWAADRGYKDVVEMLILNGANINAVDRDGKTPLHNGSKIWSKGCGGNAYLKRRQCECAR